MELPDLTARMIDLSGENQVRIGELGALKIK